MTDKLVCAFTAVCEEDAHWLPQYLAEAERLSMPFVMLFDRCSVSTQHLVAGHPLCVDAAFRDESAGEFVETCKQHALDAVKRLGYAWAMAWDVDETFARAAPDRIDQACRLNIDTVDCIDVRWVNLWGDDRHVRVDGPFGSGHRTKFYNLLRSQYTFLSPTVNGPTSDKRARAMVVRRHDIVCVHHGNMLREWRASKKERWDRIYTAAAGRQPYGFWDYMCDEETYPPVVAEWEG